VLITIYEHRVFIS